MKQGDLFAGADADPKPKREHDPKTKRPGAKPSPDDAAPAPLPASKRAAQAGRRIPAVETARAEATAGAFVPVDAEARRLAVTCFDRPILLAAGAGTGKTATLVARVLQWCLGPGWDREDDGDAQPEDVAVRVLRGVSAITFTEAAAAEMSTRVARALARVQRVTAGADGVAAGDMPLGLVPAELPAEPERLFTRARALRAALEQLNVSTIHAFCRRLLAAHPLQVGLDPAFAVDATFSQIEIVLREVLEAYLREAWAEPVDEDLVTLARHGVGPPEIERAIVDLVDAGARAEDFAEDPLSDERCAELRVRLERALADVARASAPLAHVKGNTHIAFVAIAESVPVVAARATLDELRAGLLAVWADARALERVRKWSNEDVNQREGKALGDGAPELARAGEAFCDALEPVLGLDAALLGAARRVVGRVLGEVQAELRRRGVATFGDLLTEARRLLLENEAVAARERGRIRQLLVDEFQDTDGIQCDIVRALGLGGAPESRPGLFLVGDPKQSIFAWRNADLEAFDAFSDAVREAGGLRLDLSCNFRSRGAILDEVERSIAGVMEEERGVQPAFAPLTAARDADDEHSGRGEHDRPSVEYWLSWPVDPVTGDVDPDLTRSKGPSYVVEALALAHDVAGRRFEEDSRWSDFAVLFRSFTDIEPYLEQLRVLGIPYEVQSDRNYYRRREVIDAAALVRAVIDPNDHLALVTLLRSPVVGVPDAALLPLWEQGLPGAVTRLSGPDEKRLAELRDLVAAAARKVPRSIPGIDAVSGWDASLVAALEAIAESRRSFRDDPADAWIETMRTRFPLEATESARFLGSYRLANQERFFRDVLRAVEERGGDVQSIVRTLRANLAREDRSEAARPSDSGQDAVNVLTIHGSKGLEFKHVYLAQTHKHGPTGSERTTAFDRRGGRASYQLFGVSAPDWHETERRRGEAEAAERVRLLYVALTRAVDRLVVLGGFPVVPKTKTWRRARTIVDLLEHRPRAGDAARELAARAARGDLEPWTDEWGAVWRLAAGIAGPRATGAGDGDGDGDGDGGGVASPEDVERESRTLARHREEARRRGARPFHRAASAEAHGEAAEQRAARQFAEGEHETPATGTGAALARPAPIGRAAAKAAGTAVHRVLELFDFTAGSRDEELARRRAALPELVARLASGEDAEAATGRALELLDAIRANGLLERLADLAPHVVARELAVLLPVDPDVAGDDEGAPVGFVSGAIDLVYRDPSSGDLVVADYKTDAAGDDGDLGALVATYTPQGRTYVEAVREALALEAAPRFELWFLAAGRVEPVRFP